MNRRDFLARFLGGAVGAALAPALDLDKLLWVPGERTIFLPPPPVINELVSVDWMFAEALRLLKTQLTAVAGFNRPFDDVRLGDAVRVPLPVRFDPARPTPAWPTKTVTLDRQYHCQIDMGDVRGLNRAQISQGYLEPHMAWMAKRLREAGVNVFGALPLPAGVDEAYVAASDHVALRAVKGYDLEHDDTFVRFDVLGGTA